MILIRIDFKLSLSKSNHINFWNKKPKPKKQSNLILDVILLLKNLYVDTIQILNVDTIQKNLEELEKHDQIQPIRTSKLTIFNLTFKFIFNQIHFYVKIMTQYSLGTQYSYDTIQ